MAERNAQQGLELVQRLARRLTREAIAANPAPAALVAEILGLALAKQYRLPDDLKARFRTLCQDAIEDQVPPSGSSSTISSPTRSITSRIQKRVKLE